MINITVNREELLPALKVLAPLAKATKTQHPILSDVVIQPMHLGLMRLEATDLTAYATVLVNACTNAATLRSEKPVCTPLQPLLALVKALPKATAITITGPDDKGRLTVAGALLDTHDQGDFPQQPDSSGELSWTTSYDEVSAIVSALGPIASTDPTRAQLQGIFLDHNAAVATDGKALAEWKVKGHIKQTALIPLLSAKVMGALCDLGSDDPVTLHVDDVRKQATLTTSSGTVITRLIEGDFPDYRGCLPDTSPETRVDVEVKALRQAIERAAAVLPRVKDKNKVVHITIGDDGLVITSDALPAAAPVPGSTADGDGDAYLDPERLVKALKTFGKARMTLALHGERKPVSVSANEHTYWCMPCNRQTVD